MVFSNRWVLLAQLGPFKRDPGWACMAKGGAMGPEASAFRFLTIAMLILVIRKLYPSKGSTNKPGTQPRGTELLVSSGARPTLIPSG